MDLQINNSAETVSVSDLVFGAEFREALVHQVVVAYLAGGRAGTKAQKNRSAVSGGGAKPWRQKGTGRARAGTIRSPLWRGGGKTFASVPRDHGQKVNRKQYRGAMRAILAELVRQNRLTVVSELSMEQPKTKMAVEMLSGLGVASGLIVDVEFDGNAALALRNIPGVDLVPVGALDPVGLVGAESVVMTAAAVKAIEEKLA